ncbi:DUF222 domain-containing protein [Agreia sp.]|uniref:HNH endonuclease signature motif containing protein n=1 Tax=Agreia sp. TaxID=1872416 RepID=UPI0035BC0597
MITEPDSRLVSSFRTAIDEVHEVSRQIASLQAERARLVTVARAAGQALNPVDRSGGGPQWSTEAVARREFATELASAENLSERAAYALIETSYELAETFVHTHRALYCGDISLRHAEIIVQFGSCLPDEKQLEFELRMLELAKKQPVHLLRTRAGREAKAATMEDAVERHLNAAEARITFVDTADDDAGMSVFGIRQPAVENEAIRDRVHRFALALRAAGDPRTITQLHADVASDLLLNGYLSMPGAPAHAVRAHVYVTVPALSLLGFSDESASLEGYGPIDALTATRLTANAPYFSRVLTDPATGAVITAGITRYRPDPRMRELVDLIHVTCRFPGCTRVARDCDADHNVPFPLGETSIANLVPQCAPHHKVKHKTAWQFSTRADGTVISISPSGHTRQHEPPSLARPAPRRISFRDAPDNADKPARNWYRGTVDAGIPGPPVTGDDEPPF